MSAEMKNQAPTASDLRQYRLVQSFNGVGWIGIALLFACPIIGGIVAGNAYHDYAIRLSLGLSWADESLGAIWTGLAISGLGSLAGFLMVLIGREFRLHAEDGRNALGR